MSDKLVPLEPLDLGKIKSVDDLVRAMGNTAFTGRQVGEGAEVVEAMARDQECFVVMTLAGAMTVAKQGLIITDLIDAGVVNAVVSTGALMAHGLVEAAGRSHFRYDPRMDDNELYDAGYNRVYDTLEPETNLDFVETIVARILKGWDHNEPLCSYKLNRDIGKYLSENVHERGILKSAYEKGVPVFVPAFSDSEIGLDFALHNRARRKNNIPPLRYDPFEDLEYYAETLLKQNRLGIFTIGGGVPRNWAQQFGPYIDLAASPGRGRPAAQALSLWRAHLSRTGQLGRPLGLHLQRSGLVGQVRSAGRRRQVRRSVAGRNRRLAADRRCGAGADQAIGSAPANSQFGNPLRHSQLALASSLHLSQNG